MTAVGPESQYERFADDFSRHAETSFYNAFLDRPACLALLGDVSGKRVLDAACGPGIYAAELVLRGAAVSAFDQSPQMVALCRSRVPAADVRVHSLGDPLDWLPTASVDLVLLALALEYVNDRVGALRELRRVLRPSGALVLSRLHPTADWLRHGGDYFTPSIVHEVWSRGWEVHYWTMPLQQTCEELFEAGFLIERLVEPRPLPSAAAIDPETYRRLTTEPAGLLAFRAVPRQ